MDQTRISRRFVLGAVPVVAGAGLVAAGDLSAPALAKAPLTGRQVAGVYRTKVAGFEVTAISDGYITLKSELLSGPPKAELDALLTSGFLDPDKVTAGITTYVLNDGARTILVDAGAASAFGPTAGKLQSNLSAAGISPDAIDAVLITHMHPDHTAGLISNGKAVFPNAELIVSDKDAAFWTNTANAASAPEMMKTWFDLNATVAKAYPKLIRHDGKTEVSKGITAMALPGHTPGHCGYIVGTDNDRLVLLGDTVFMPQVFFARPETAIVFDFDKDEAVKTRKSALDMLATDKVLFAASHLPFPTFGRVARSGTAYAWVQDAWRYE
ncbi:MAG: MBL fold metallo-hydrolase [Hyphomicrobiaceae bacterium]|nr:MBL fold metallo-hydrolase [Hyphomicrobiaceae bacterium]